MYGDFVFIRDRGNGLWPYFLKYSANYSCFETIKYRVPVLKLDFLKIEFQCNSIL